MKIKLKLNQKRISFVKFIFNLIIITYDDERRLFICLTNTYVYMLIDVRFILYYYYYYIYYKYKFIYDSYIKIYNNNTPFFFINFISKHQLLYFLYF